MASRRHGGQGGQGAQGAQGGSEGWLRRFVDALWGDPTLQRAKRLQRRSTAESLARRPEQALALQRDAVVLFRRVGAVMPQHRGQVAVSITYLGKCQSEAKQH